MPMPKARRERESAERLPVSRETWIEENGAGAEEIKKTERGRRRKMLKEKTEAASAEEAAKVKELKSGMGLDVEAMAEFEPELKELRKRREARRTKAAEAVAEEKHAMEKTSKEMAQKVIAGKATKEERAAYRAQKAKEAELVLGKAQETAAAYAEAQLSPEEMLERRGETEMARQHEQAKQRFHPEAPELTWGESEITENVALLEHQNKAREAYQKLERQSQKLAEAFGRLYNDDLASFSLGLSQQGVVSRFGRGIGELLQRGASALAGEPFKSRSQFAGEYQKMSEQMDRLRAEGYGLDMGAISRAKMEGAAIKHQVRAKAEANRPAGEERVKRALEREEERAAAATMPAMTEENILPAEQAPVEDLTKFAKLEEEKREETPHEKYLRDNAARIELAKRLLTPATASAMRELVESTLGGKSGKSRISVELGLVDPATEYVLLVADRLGALAEADALSAKNRLSPADRRKLDELTEQIETLATDIQTANKKLGLPNGLNVTLPFEIEPSGAATESRMREAA